MSDDGRAAVCPCEDCLADPREGQDFDWQEGMTADTRVTCPDCGGTGKTIGSVPGVPASVCMKLTPCERCWPRNEDGTTKVWNDGTAGTIPASPSASSTVPYEGDKP